MTAAQTVRPPATGGQACYKQSNRTDATNSSTVASACSTPHDIDMIVCMPVLGPAPTAAGLSCPAALPAVLGACWQVRLLLASRLHLPTPWHGCSPAAEA